MEHLSRERLVAGLGDSWLARGSLGCAKFVERFGAEAMRFVNSRIGRKLRLRGMNARVVVPGTVRLGDLAAKAPVRLAPHASA